MYYDMCQSENCYGKNTYQFCSTYQLDSECNALRHLKTCFMHMREPEARRFEFCCLALIVQSLLFLNTKFQAPP